MSSLQSLREFIGERLAAAAEEIFRHCEGTIVQYEQELCRQRRLLDICWKPQLQLHNIFLPQHWVIEEKDLCNQHRNFREEKKDPEPPQIKEEQKEPEHLQIEDNEEHQHIQVKEEQKEPEHLQIEDNEEHQHIQVKEEQKEPEHLQIEENEEHQNIQVKEEQERFSISQKEEKLDVKQETDTLMEISINAENENSEADLNNQQILDETDCHNKEGNQNEKSTSTADEERKPKNTDQVNSADRSHVLSQEISHMSEGRCESDVRKNLKTASLGEECTQTPKEKTDESSRTFNNLYIRMRTKHNETLYVCKKCRKGFYNMSQFVSHIREKPFSCKECDKTFCQRSTFTSHMRTHKGYKPVYCKERGGSFSQTSVLKSHMKTHAGEKSFTCKECSKSCRTMFSLKTHMKAHRRENPCTCKRCGRSLCDKSSLKRHMYIHTRKKPC